MTPIEARFSGRIGGFSLDVAFAAPPVGATALFGPSGCGKTTVLRCIAGLERLAGGFFSLGEGEVWQDGRSFLPPHRRAVGYVFQEASLFPHLSVTANLRYGLRRAADRGIAFDEVVELLGLSPLLARTPAKLSGGERQRVAVGRALLSQPRLLVMDEPLAALDRISKDEILPYLERLHDALSIPLIYVSHDLAEVERLADHLVLMAGGRVTAAGPLAQVLADPALPFCRRADAATVLEGEVIAVDETYGLSRVAVAGAELLVPDAAPGFGVRRRLRIAAGDVSLCLQEPHRTSILNVLPARVEGFLPGAGGQCGVRLRLGGNGAALIARISEKSRDGLGLKTGDAVFAQVKGVALVDSREPGCSPIG
jgi:molybdate transport system ATP-binding protein